MNVINTVIDVKNYFKANKIKNYRIVVDRKEHCLKLKFYFWFYSIKKTQRVCQMIDNGFKENLIVGCLIETSFGSMWDYIKDSVRYIKETKTNGFIK